MKITDWIAFDWRGMNRHDREAWAVCSSLIEVGTVTAAWLNGELTQTPSHGGPPDEETVPHTDVLIAANLAGFVTTNMQSAISAAEAEANDWRECEAYAQGFVSAATLERLRDVIGGTGLEISGARLRRTRFPGIRLAETFGPASSRWTSRVRRSAASFYRDRCPAAADEISDSWLVIITDPEPGR